MSDSIDYDGIAAFLQERTQHRPRLAVICGSGLANLSNSLEQKDTFAYEDIPGFPSTTVAGHTGELVFGTLGGQTVVCMRGRFHSYEGHDMATVGMPCRVFARLGVEILIVTNAAGGLNPNWNIGDIAVLADHCSFPGLAGRHPLVGPNDDSFGPRFPATSDTYTPRLQQLAQTTARELGYGGFTRTGAVYTFVSGPSYETPTESKLLRMVGGDVVGMSTIPEVIVAKHAGLKILGLSLVTNKVVLPGDFVTKAASHAEVLANVKARTVQVESLVKSIICNMDRLEAMPDERPQTEAQEAAAEAAQAAGAARRRLAGLAVAAAAVGVGRLFMSR